MMEVDSTGLRLGRDGTPITKGTRKKSISPNDRRSKSSTSKAVLQQFRELFRVSQHHFQRIEASCGLSGAQLWALAEVKAAPGLKISELARVLSVHLSTASYLVDRLEVRSLVRRERNKEDQRIVRVFATSEGARLLQAAPEPTTGVIPDALDRMSLEGLRALNRELTTLLALIPVRDRRARMTPLADL